MRIPKNTPTFVFDTTNPKGALRGVGDCVIRSISLATGKTWREVYRELTEIGMKKGRMPNDRVVFAEYLKREGWKVFPQPRKANNRRLTTLEFIQSRGKGKRVLISQTLHLTCCLEDGKIHDTWDCTSRVVGRYWVKD